ncbi:MAG: diacylglycerol kinase family protein [bacterium]|nr:diacylglycerol kinase family protein [bacterium]
MSFRKKIQNIRPSWLAIVTLWREEFSFRVQTVTAVVILALSYALQISTTEFLIVLLTIGAVLAVEALNTAIEELCDHVTPEEHPSIGKVKDLGSGAALLMGITATIIGLVIFIPYIVRLI